MSTPPPSALAGVRVLDLASVGPAARASAILADYGADIVKVAPVPRDAQRQIVPAYYAYSGQRGTRRVQIDLKADAGREAFLGLVASADVVIESFRPGVLDRLGLGFAVLAATRPELIVCSTSGYGQTGPRAATAGHDIDYQAVAGALWNAERAPDDKPGLPGATFADSAGGGMHAVIAILAALLRRQTTGHGEHLDVSITDGVLNLTSLIVDEHLATGSEPGPGHDILSGRYACYGAYQCADGAWVAVGAIEPAFFANLCRGLGCDEWIDAQLDDAAQPRIRAALTTAFAARARSEWLEALGPADTCIAPVNDIASVVSDPQLVARGVFVEAEHPVHGRFRQLGPLLAGMDPAPEVTPVPDVTITDTDAVFAEAGLTPAAITELRTAGVVA
ncbi:MAG TPA: CaiB/BaiF CoA-transferase family protein [Acidimicrobiales bacterium]|nr:CaiB/BaiF CoA-transferase family protein [Acidimicrobiales bacterium]